MLVCVTTAGLAALITIKEICITALISRVCNRYYSIVTGPVRLSLPGPDDVPRYFDQFPSFKGTGMSITLWYRHCDPGDLAICEGYLLYATNKGLDSESCCWAVYVQGNGLYFRNVNGTPPYFYLLDFMAGEEILNNRVWRHLAFVWNITDNHVSVYLDGKLGVTAPWGSNVSSMDCFEHQSEQDNNLNASQRPSGNVVAIGQGLPNSYPAGNLPVLFL